jgi:23S rRNA (adenine1618-N6)-methyltransferase
MKTKSLHKNNIHNSSYDFELLCANENSLKEFVFENKYDTNTIDFSSSNAVKALNKALLKTHYNISYWDIPQNYLCPPIPGRADYIHYISDLLGIKSSSNILGLDIGVGANGIYPILGNSIYNWKFVCSDISSDAINNVNKIIQNNPKLKDNITCILQNEKHEIFNNIINPNDRFDFTMCNPPFHSSSKEALKGTNRKNKNLNIKDNILNFGGMANELWCKNGESAFIKKMIKQSIIYKYNVLWFTTLVSKKENLKDIQKHLKKLNVFDIKIIEMIQGNKQTRFVAWTFFDEKEQKIWKNKEKNKK